MKPIEVCAGPDIKLHEGVMDPHNVIEGTPVCRSTRWSGSRDRMASNYVWDCTAGRFRWYFDRDETVFVIEGEVEVSGEEMDPTWLRAGDAALFRAGTWSTWYVPQYVRKHAVIRRGLPGPLRLVVECGRLAKNVVNRILGRRLATDDDAQLLHQL